MYYVMGAFHSGSQDLHAILEVLSDRKINMWGLARGREGSEWTRSSIMSDLRRELSLAGPRPTLSQERGREKRGGELGTLGYKCAEKEILQENLN